LREQHDRRHILEDEEDDAASSTATTASNDMPGWQHLSNRDQQYLY